MKVYVGDHMYENVGLDAPRMRGDRLWFWNGWSSTSFGESLYSHQWAAHSFYDQRPHDVFLSRSVSR